MKRHYSFPLLAVLTILLAAGSVYAQTRRVVANVPFDYMIGNKALPAGQYDIQPAGDLGVLAIVGTDHATFATSYRAQASKPAEQSKLVFHRYGNRYFLSQIWIQGSEVGRELPKSRLEKEEMIRAANRAPETVVVAALY
ncbi:MAG TPA: hypothetical protein VEV41_11205 [Terriglobales bacterium]|nr:hypothetical protein [Terriglobales bacterium]